MEPSGTPIAESKAVPGAMGQDGIDGNARCRFREEGLWRQRFVIGFVAWAWPRVSTRGRAKKQKSVLNFLLRWGQSTPCTIQEDSLLSEEIGSVPDQVLASRLEERPQLFTKLISQ